MSRLPSLPSALSARTYASTHVATAALLGLVLGWAVQHWAVPQYICRLARSGREVSGGAGAGLKNSGVVGEKRDGSSKAAEKGEDILMEDVDGDDATTDETDTDSESESEAGGTREHKMILVVRTDLGMGKGKMAAQCCHAAVAAVDTARRTQPATLRRYERYGAAKVAVKCQSEEELMELFVKARKAGLIAEYIEDAGRTQIPEGSRTVLAVGPGPIEAVNAITGHLKLL
ncbi:peptidyl-tRNA hydrolase PTH2-domain-containing protein [Fimicolochytrium jonesii]|uniref:peptidyl-tRNA hydrolase PTH2-domain-containing protein n=1 Tax=Fimicolochytrium jonesii TaxID=1396493 RepID=UPI0022FED6EE|nr:peptidyl-tRNA hydrolase PTH2-domain-containing protein [Fimicolochytrium jonesii]KAI8817681.1 peptidyl-tRNA hydrolase PTH2-domain-containing protein [Fimicolochytrium jonesii]